MSKSILIWGGAAVVVLGLLGFGGWVLSLPTAMASAEAPPVPQEETDAMLAALQHQGEGRPVIAVIGINDATETNDYVTTTGILRRADVADVVMLATGPGPVQLYPVLRVEPDATIAEFDAEHPDGADYVIVPAMSRDDDPAVLAWLQDQSRKGATIIGSVPERRWSLRPACSTASARPRTGTIAARCSNGARRSSMSRTAAW